MPESIRTARDLTELVERAAALSPAMNLNDLERAELGKALCRWLDRLTAK